MAGSRFGSIVMGMLISATLQLFAGNSNTTQAHSVIRVSVYDYAQIPASDLDRAKGTAAQIFRQAGLEMVWTDVPVFKQAEVARTQAPRRLGVADLRLRILPESKVPGWAKKSKGVAFSLLPSNGAPGIFTSIYFERLLAISRRENRPAGLVLGCVIAHELGHLLLNMKGHSRTGIMSFPVTRQYLSQASRGRLVFAASQSKRLRREVGKRITRDQKATASLLARGETAISNGTEN